MNGWNLALAVLAAPVWCHVGAAAAQHVTDNSAGNRSLLRMADGESRSIYGVDYAAEGAVLAILVPSSELISVAVLEGRLSARNQSAGAGGVLVITIDSGETAALRFDAARLAATLPPAWATAASPALDSIAARQRRQLFWGRLEPVGANAAAPVVQNTEALRVTYLAEAAVVELRRAAAGNVDTLAQLTAERFAAALGNGDIATVAALIDPQPFLATGQGPAIWQAARTAFATRLTQDSGVRTALTGATVAPVTPGENALFRAGAPDRQPFHIALVARDRALFVISLEQGS